MIILKLYSLLSEKEKLTVLKLLFIMISVMILEMIAVVYLVPLVEIFSTRQHDDNYILMILNLLFSNLSEMDFIYYALLIYVFLYLLKNISSLALFWYQASFSNLLRVRMSKDLMAYYIRKPYEFHIGQNSSELIRNAFTEVGTVVGAGVQPILQITTEVLVIIGLTTVLLVVEPSGALIAMILSTILLYVIFHYLKSYLYRWGKEREYHEGMRIKYIQQGLASVKDIKIFGGEQDFVGKYRYHALESAYSTIKHASIQQVPRLAIESLVIVLVVFYISYNIHIGEEVNQMSSVLAVFAVSALRLMPSANRIITALQSIRYGMPVVETIYEDLYDYKNNYQKKIITGNINVTFCKDIRLKKITYSYPNSMNKKILSDISLTIKKGDKVALIGESGSGKSTLINIIMGLLPQSKGVIEVDGVDIRENIGDWQKKISYVPQDIFLLDETLAENIAFGINKIDRERVWSVIKQAQLYDVVRELPEKIDTIVGERGIRFSGGQRQRIGLARALYHQPEILVLDEATSSLDVDTEKRIMETVYNLGDDLTIIIITHRESTIYACNNIIRVNSGRIERKK